MRTAIVVPGNGSFDRHGVYRIGGRCRPLVEEAERLVAQLGAGTVVFTGWSPGGGPTEAEQMLASWRGPDVELVAESTATITAQNASRTLPLLLDRGIERAVVVCAPLHLFRARFLFSRVYGPEGIETRFRAARVPISARALAWELAALPVLRPQLRGARSEIARHGGGG